MADKPTQDDDEPRSTEESGGTVDDDLTLRNESEGTAVDDAEQEPAAGELERELEVSEIAQDSNSGDATEEATLAEGEEPAANAPPEQADKPRGRLLAAIALLFGLIAVGGVGYLYYLLVYLEPFKTLEAKSATVRADSDALRTELNAEIERVRAEAERLSAETRESVAELVKSNEDAVIESLNEAINQAPPSEREWRLAEAEYLLRIANHRVLMEDDSIGALRLLKTADEIMAELDDFALHQVRARLADEILALQQVRRQDVQGIYLRLEALKDQVDDLPIATPDYLDREQPIVEDRTVWQVLAAELQDLVRIRTISGGDGIKPILAPEEERYLELNLRLSIEQAQLAVLKRHQGVYEHSLSRVREWLGEYLDENDERTVAVMQTVDELLNLELARDLPDVSGSLRELVAIRRAATP